MVLLKIADAAISEVTVFDSQPEGPGFKTTNV